VPRNILDGIHGMKVSSSSLWATYTRWIIGGSIGAVLLTFAGKLTFNLAVNLLTLWFEHTSGYFQTPPSKPETKLSDQEKHAAPKEPGFFLPQGRDNTPKQQPRLQIKGDNPAASSQESQSKPKTSEPAESEPPLVEVTFDHFAATYSSLSERDRAAYIRSLAGKRVKWAAYIKQMYLYQNTMYLSDEPGKTADVSVAVNFTDEMRLSIGPVNSKIRVSGTVEIREQWVVINATELGVAR
jgi:hypothetical protein